MYRPNNPISDPTHTGYVLIVTIEEGLKNNKFGEHTQLVTACHNVIVDLINEVYTKEAKK